MKSHYHWHIEYTSIDRSDSTPSGWVATRKHETGITCEHPMARWFVHDWPLVTCKTCLRGRDPMTGRFCHA